MHFAFCSYLLSHRKRETKYEALIAIIKLLLTNFRSDIYYTLTNNSNDFLANQLAATSEFLFTKFCFFIALLNHVDLPLLVAATLLHNQSGKESYGHICSYIQR